MGSGGGNTGSFGDKNKGLAGDITISGGIKAEGVDAVTDAECVRFVDADGVVLIPA